MNEAIVRRKPSLERIHTDSSIFIHLHSGQRANLPFWHFHPELELVYVEKGQGKRHIWNHLSYFHNSQLLLIGANLPHHGFSDRLTTRGSETIIQFKPDFLGEYFLVSRKPRPLGDFLKEQSQGYCSNLRSERQLGQRSKRSRIIQVSN